MVDADPVEIKGVAPDLFELLGCDGGDPFRAGIREFNDGASVLEPGRYEPQLVRGEDERYRGSVDFHLEEVITDGPCAVKAA